MATTPEPIKGVPRLEGNPALDLRADFNALATWVQTNVGLNVPDEGSLPLSENWVGRLCSTDDGLLYICTALPGTWKLVNPGEVRALVTAGRTSFTALGNNDLTVVHDPLGMVSAATDTVIIPLSGIYLVTFNMIQSGTTA